MAAESSWETPKPRKIRKGNGQIGGWDDGAGPWVGISPFDSAAATPPLLPEPSPPPPPSAGFRTASEGSSMVEGEKKLR